jgi:hypothetical protein
VMNTVADANIYGGALASHQAKARVAFPRGSSRLDSLPYRGVVSFNECFCRPGSSEFQC